MPSPPAFDVFLSHNSAEKPAAEDLARRLAHHGVTSFVDDWALVPGTPWQEALEAALSDASTCGVLIGATGLGVFENEEMRSALEERARNPSFRVIPILLPGASPQLDTAVPRFLRRLTWVDFRSGLDQVRPLQKFLAGVRGVAPGPPELVVSKRDADISPQLLRLGLANPAPWRRAHLIGKVARAVAVSGSGVIMRGLPGTGKSQLLGQCLGELAGGFDHVVALSFTGSSAIDPRMALADLEHVVPADRRQAPEAQFSTSAATLIATTCSSLADLSLLICADDVDAAPFEWRHALLTVLPSYPGIRVIATATSSEELSPARIVTVGPLDWQEALALAVHLIELLDIAADPELVVAGLPEAVWSHPQALAAVVAQLIDLPIELIGLEAVGDDLTLAMNRAIADLRVQDYHVLALVEMLGGCPFADALRLLDIEFANEERGSLTRLVQRSLVQRRDDGFSVPELVAAALGAVGGTERAAVTARIATALGGVREAEWDPTSALLASVAASVTANLAQRRAWSFLLVATADQLLDRLNAHGHWRELSVILRAALPAASASGDDEREVELALMLIRKLPQVGFDLDSEALLDRAEQVLDGQPLSREHGLLHSHRALLELARGETHAARTQMELASGILAEHGRPQDRAAVETLVGNAYLRDGDYDLARAKFASAISIGGIDVDVRHSIDAQISMALCDLHAGSFDDAETRLRQMITLADTNRFVAGQQRGRLHLAMCLDERGDLPEAIALASWAADEVHGDPAVARVASVLAWRLRRRRDRPQGEQPS